MLKLIHAIDMQFENVKDYYNSFENNLRNLNCRAITRVVDGPKSYFDYINTYVPNLYYLINDEKPNYIIGFGTIEDSTILDYHMPYLNTGNIGYGIRPTERKKGYRTHLLNLLLLKCEELVMSEVCVSCLKENVASKKIIINNNGKLEKEFFNDYSGKYGLKFWIKLHPRIIDRGKRQIKRMKEGY